MDSRPTRTVSQDGPEIRPALFQRAWFTLHSGQQSEWKINCEALTGDDWVTLAFMLSQALPPFGSVEGVPSGGLRLADALLRYKTKGNSTLLIVDDVLTTGASMEEQRQGRDAIGAVVFARSVCPPWITPLFRMQAAALACLEVAQQTKDEEHDPLCSEGRYAGDQVMPCDCRVSRADAPEQGAGSLKEKKSMDAFEDDDPSTVPAGTGDTWSAPLRKPVTSDEIPRRCRVDQWTPGERAIDAALQAVEAMPADLRLTDAVVLLKAAQASVADFIDGVDQRRLVDTPVVAHTLRIDPDVTHRAASPDRPTLLRTTFTNEVIRAIGALARQQNVCREQGGQVVFVTGMEAAREYIVEHVQSVLLVAGPIPAPQAAALTKRIMCCVLDYMRPDIDKADDGQCVIDCTKAVEALLVASGLADATPPAKDLKWTLDNIYTIARREINRIERPGHTSPDDPHARWSHVVRLCEKAGCQGRGVLRDNGGPLPAPPVIASEENKR